MTARAEYTDEEWTLLYMSPWAVGFAVSFGDQGGAIRETFSIATATATVRERYPGNELLASVWSTRLDTAPAPEPIPGTDVGRIGDELLKRAVETCRRVVALLEERSHPEEAEGFRRFLADVALDVANAAGGGPLGGAGAHISSSERVAVDAVRAALGLAPLAIGENPEGSGAASGPKPPPAPDTVRGATGIPTGPIEPE
jgi:hypothetical protein